MEFLELESCFKKESLEFLTTLFCQSNYETYLLTLQVNFIATDILLWVWDSGES
jgi:hypothetical protein